MFIHFQSQLSDLIITDRKLQYKRSRRSQPQSNKINIFGKYQNVINSCDKIDQKLYWNFRSSVTLSYPKIDSKNFMVLCPLHSDSESHNDPSVPKRNRFKGQQGRNEHYYVTLYTLLIVIPGPAENAIHCPAEILL